MALTPNYNLQKPAQGTTPYDALINGNFDAIDTQMKANADAAAGGGGIANAPNQVIVDNVNGVAGGGSNLVFDTLANAIIYVDAQLPTIANQWQVLLYSNTDASSVTLKEGVSMASIGVKCTLTGAINVQGVQKVIVDSINFTGLVTIELNKNLIAYNCIFVGGITQTGTATNSFLNNCITFSNALNLSGGIKFMGGLIGSVTANFTGGLTSFENMELNLIDIEGSDLITDGFNAYNCFITSSTTKAGALNQFKFNIFNCQVDNFIVNQGSIEGLINGGQVDILTLQASTFGSLTMTNINPVVTNNGSVSIITKQNFYRKFLLAAITSTIVSSKGSVNTNLIHWPAGALVETDPMSQITSNPSATSGYRIGITKDGYFQIRLNIKSTAIGPVTIAILKGITGTVNAGLSTAVPTVSDVLAAGTRDNPDAAGYIQSVNYTGYLSSFDNLYFFADAAITDATFEFNRMS